MGIFRHQISRKGDESRIDVDGIFEGLFRKHYAALFFYANRILDQLQAEDVVQDAFADLWERRDSLDLSGNIRAFLYRSVYTRCLNRLKHDAIAKNYGQAQINVYIKKAEYMSPDNNEVIKQLEDTETGVKIEHAIEALPPKCREVFRLSYLYDMKNAQIALALGISLRTVEAHMYKALKSLREELWYLR